ncbi:NUDIX domain-containing protein [Kaistia geumhonensis]|uniref:8-oxo-dGTP pyrophosphatase MutT (NUDIX family) n=1 Tax=Kaistia geumhonensis TaxID=410839 RepID=A0ABU0M7T0_9HYPH|nr:NUDIX domain-containing protein [Kaistia geumhonensis]MCX5477917.1 NUDIX domain-containing protein [Kaistia geumhonensis]MDQ0516870.1 8-oxo-dGTP pyrophosphatase MutT (NUDIX family) [Kaistia geumhonensis]
MDQVIRIAAGLIVDADGRALVVRKQGAAVFMQPGGKIEQGESPAAALIRELGEELGLVVAAESLEPLGRFSAPAANEAGFTVVADLFRVPYAGGAKPGAEIAEIALVDPSAPDRPLAELSRRHILPLATPMAD